MNQSIGFDYVERLGSLAYVDKFDSVKRKLSQESTTETGKRLKTAEQPKEKIWQKKKKPYLFYHDIGVGREISVSSRGDCVFLTTWKQGRNGQKQIHKEKSVVISLMRWRMLHDFAELIDSVVDKMMNGGSFELERFHLGGSLHLCMTTMKCVDIRVWYTKRDENGIAVGELLPGKPGISLKCAEWKNLSEHLSHISKSLNIDSIVPCYLSESHSNQEGMWNCPECTFPQDPPVEV